MDSKFPNGDEGEIKSDINNEEEFVLFSKDKGGEADAENVQSNEENIPGISGIEEPIEEEDALDSGLLEEDNALDAEERKPVIEKKKVAAPEKTRKEKTQTVLFFIIIGLGILAVIILIAAGIFTLSNKYGWFDKKENEAELSTDAADGTEADQSKTNYSLYIEDNGYIKDIKASDYVKLCDYKNIVIDYEDIKPSDSEIQEQIDSVLASFETLDTEADAVTALGDTVNIDYVGTVDGVAFEGGDTKGAGTDLKLGSNKYIDDFEEQLVGYKVGDNVTVEVTFPENYGNEELNGKDAVFEVTINGIYTVPEFTDDFVKENLSDYADTADGYRAHIEELLAENNKTSYVWNYVKENSEVTDYPSDYLQNEVDIYTMELDNQYNYYNEYYYAATGQYQWNSIYEFYEVEESEYDDLVKGYAEDGTKQVLIAQAIAEDSNIEVTQDDLLDYLTGIGYDSSSLESIAEKYGQGYIYQNALYTVVERTLLANVTVNK